MKNLTNAKKVLVMMAMVILIGISTSVFAAETSDGFNIIPIDGGTNTSAGTSGSSNGTANSSGSLLTSGNSSTNRTAGTNSSNTSGTTLTGSSNNSATSDSSRNTSNTGNTGNSSTYTSNTNNSSNLPDTGLEDSLPVVVLVVVLGVSAIYAFKKIKDYQNL